MDKCPGLIGGLNDPSTSCNIPSAVDEQISGVLDKLPGNNPLGQWGVPVAEVAPAPATVVASHSASGSVGSTSSAAAKPSTAETVGSSSTATSVASPAVVAETASVQPLPLSSAVDAAGAAPTAPPAAAGGSNTLVTSYVSQTSVIWTTVTKPGAAPASTPGSSSSVAAGWSYHGCYSDSLGNGNRALSGIEFADIGNHEVTNTKCVAYCEAAGYSMAGTEYGGQCFCGNELSGSKAVDESQCNMTCEGGATETCGGSLTLSVYSKSGSTKRRSRHLHQHVRGVST